MTLADLREWDEVRITGTPTSGCNRRVVNFPCMVATVARDGSVKVWPMDDKEPQLTAEERFNGKIWFQPHTVESVALVHRDETL
jgi:hypothetical protein